MQDLPSLEQHFRLAEELGRGAFGIVYRAHAQDGQRVAVKLHQKDVDAAQQARIFREAELFKTLNHPRLTQFLGLFQNQRGELALVYELVLGHPLDAVLKRLLPEHRPPLKQVESWLRDLSEALDALHNLGLVHRDLKPANVMCEPSGFLRLLDFGLARREDQGGTLTQEGMLLGTPMYMAPETLRGERPAASADLYALACMVFEFLTGRCPFEGNPNQVVRAHLSHPPPPLSSLAPNLPQELTRVLDRSLSKAPEGRYPSGAAFLAAFSLARKGEETVDKTRGAMKSTGAFPVAKLPSSSLESTLPLPGIHSVAPAPSTAAPPRRILWGLVAVVLLALGFFLPVKAPMALAQIFVRPVPGGVWLDAPSATQANSLVVKVDEKAQEIKPGTRIFLSWEVGQRHDLNTQEKILHPLSLAPENLGVSELEILDLPVPQNFPGVVWFLHAQGLGLRFPLGAPKPDMVRITRFSQGDSRQEQERETWLLSSSPTTPEVFLLPEGAIPNYPHFLPRGSDIPSASLPPDLRAEGLFGTRDTLSEAPPVPLPPLRGIQKGTLGAHEILSLRVASSPCEFYKDEWFRQEASGGPILLRDNRLVFVDDYGKLLLFQRVPLKLERALMLTSGQHTNYDVPFLLPHPKQGIRLGLPGELSTVHWLEIPEIQGPTKLPLGKLRNQPGKRKERCEASIEGLEVDYTRPRGGRWSAERGPHQLAGTQTWVTPTQGHAGVVFWSPKRAGFVPLATPLQRPDPLPFPPFFLDGALVVGYTETRPRRQGLGTRLYNGEAHLYGVDLEKQRVRWHLLLPHRSQSPPVAFREGMALIYDGILKFFPGDQLAQEELKITEAHNLHDFRDASYNQGSVVFTAWFLPSKHLGLDVLFWPRRKVRGSIEAYGTDVRNVAHGTPENPHWYRLSEDMELLKGVVLELDKTEALGNDAGVYGARLLAQDSLILTDLFSDGGEWRTLWLDRKSMGILSVQHPAPSINIIRSTPRLLHQGPLVLPANLRGEVGGYHLYFADRIGGLYEWWAAVGPPERATLGEPPPGDQENTPAGPQ
jgi:serine/threonine-protein kinase